MERALVGHQAKLQARGPCKVKIAWLGCSLDRAVWLLNNHWAPNNKKHFYHRPTAMPVTDIVDRGILEARADCSPNQRSALLAIKFAAPDQGGDRISQPAWQVPHDQYTIASPVAMIILKDFVVQ